MATILTDSQHYTDIAAAIRAKNKSQTTYLPSEMAAAINDIPTGTGTIKVGVLRPDAELVQTWSRDFYAIADDEITLPAYQTSASSKLIVSSDIGTYAGTPTTYSYYITERVLTIPEYNTSSKSAGRQDYIFSMAGYEWYYYPNYAIKSLDRTSSYNQYTQVCASGAVSIYVYWKTASAVNVYTSNAYGVCLAIAAPTVTSNTTITIKSPQLQFRGHKTYLTEEWYDDISDIRCQYVIQLWRVPITEGVNIGWVHGTQAGSILNDLTTGTKLT